MTFIKRVRLIPALLIGCAVILTLGLLPFVTAVNIIGLGFLALLFSMARKAIKDRRD
jgi:hypothetical protein